MKKKKTHGGKRKKAGRKPVADKKQRVILYVKKSQIKEMGGEDKLKELINDSFPK